MATSAWACGFVTPTKNDQMLTVVIDVSIAKSMSTSWSE
jgi:hypothetical protein